MGCVKVEFLEKNAHKLGSTALPGFFFYKAVKQNRPLLGSLILMIILPFLCVLRELG